MERSSAAGAGLLIAGTPLVDLKATAEERVLAMDMGMDGQATVPRALSRAIGMAGW